MKNPILLLFLAVLINAGWAQNAKAVLPAKGKAVRLNPMGPKLGANMLPLSGREIGRRKLAAKQVKLYVPAINRARKSKRLNSLNGSRQALTPGNTTLLLYDSAGTYGYVGDIYGRLLKNLLTHYSGTVTAIPVEQYTAGMLNTYSRTIYLGILYDNPLPAAFKAEAMTTTKPLMWAGYNLWQIAWNSDWSGYSSTFINNFGFEFQYMDGNRYTKVNYKGYQLDHDKWIYATGKVAIDNPSIATAVATSEDDNGNQTPYIVHGGNLWYVGDNPLADSSVWDRADRSFAFLDVIHDFLGDNVATSHNAVLRIEDVSAASDPTMLRNLADVLYAENVPFVICVIPRYRDPLGYWTGTAMEKTLADSPAVVAAIQYMVSKGGEVVMHGDTHQYDDERNPSSGLSADDFEFFRMVEVNGNVVPYGPVWEDSPAWVNGKLDDGLSILSSCGFNLTGWNTPHYFASPIDYEAFQTRFRYQMCRGKVFSVDEFGYLYWTEQATPFPILDDTSAFRLPETLGYVSTPALGVTGALPSDIVARAHRQKALRDGWAGCFFHWFLDPSLLHELVVGMKNEGFTFVEPGKIPQSMSTLG